MNVLLGTMNSIKLVLRKFNMNRKIGNREIIVSYHLADLFNVCSPLFFLDLFLTFDFDINY